MVYVIVWIIFGIIGAYVAEFNRNKGYNIGSPWLWFFICLVIGVFGFIIELLILVVTVMKEANIHNKKHK